VAVTRGHPDRSGALDRSSKLPTSGSNEMTGETSPTVDPTDANGSSEIDRLRAEVERLEADRARLRLS
jgi:hypothetical protein